MIATGGKLVDKDQLYRVYRERYQSYLRQKKDHISAGLSTDEIDATWCRFAAEFHQECFSVSSSVVYASKSSERSHAKEVRREKLQELMGRMSLRFFAPVDKKIPLIVSAEETKKELLKNPRLQG